VDEKMGLMEFFRSTARLLRIISKPDWKTFWLSVKICLLGIALLGGIGYIIRLVSITLHGI
jgi:protein translocase SEC61 complex gamma subunit